MFVTQSFGLLLGTIGSPYPLHPPLPLYPPSIPPPPSPPFPPSPLTLPHRAFTSPATVMHARVLSTLTGHVI